MKSWWRTRLGRNEISRLGSSVATQPATASASASLPARSTFSSRTRSVYGSRATSHCCWSASSRKISKLCSPTVSVPRASTPLFHQTASIRRSRPFALSGSDSSWHAPMRARSAGEFSGTELSDTHPQLVSVIGRSAVSRMRWLRGRVITNMTTSATSSAVIIPGRASGVRPRPLVEREVGRHAAGADVRAADALLAQLVVERTREADLAELRRAVDGLVRQAATAGLGGERDDVRRRRSSAGAAALRAPRTASPSG